uniref:Bcl-2-like protein from testis n=1 Tax=Sciurus vulgaris TaxID=55149 RepID=A0A8D2ARD1_SCIVU
MGNNSSHKRTKAPKQAHKERPPDMDKGRPKQFSSHLQRKKPSVSGEVGERGGTKIVLLFPLDKRQQLAEAAAAAAAGPGARPGRSGENAPAPAAAPMLRGAGDCAETREGARAREMKKILVLLLLLDARLQEEGRRAGSGAGSGGGPGGGAKAAQGWQRLYARLLTESEADGEGDPREEQPRKRRRCPRPRP